MCSLVPLRKAAYLCTVVQDILLRREPGRNNAEMYAVLVVTPPPPPLQREVTFQKGGRNDARVRYMYSVGLYTHGECFQLFWRSHDLTLSDLVSMESSEENRLD